jgi:DNA-directed RNA polymerase
MQWIKEIATSQAKLGRPLEWTSPSGFPVVMGYYETNAKRIETFLGRKRVKLNVAEHTSKLQAHKQRSAAAPNVIHSLDAAHLHLTVAAMLRQGVPQLCMIHDSFGTVPGHTETLATTLRKEFVQMYEDYDIFDALRTRAGAEIELPLQGSLDIRSVMESPYFFC